MMWALGGGTSVPEIGLIAVALASLTAGIFDFSFSVGSLKGALRERKLRLKIE